MLCIPIQQTGLRRSEKRYGHSQRREDDGNESRSEGGRRRFIAPALAHLALDALARRPISHVAERRGALARAANDLLANTGARNCGAPFRRRLAGRVECTGVALDNPIAAVISRCTLSGEARCGLGQRCANALIVDARVLCTRWADSALEGNISTALHVRRRQETTGISLSGASRRGSLARGVALVVLPTTADVSAVTNTAVDVRSGVAAVVHQAATLPPLRLTRVTLALAAVSLAVTRVERRAATARHWRSAPVVNVPAHRRQIRAGSDIGSAATSRCRRWTRRHRRARVRNRTRVGRRQSKAIRATRHWDPRARRFLCVITAAAASRARE
jgi:hypothetical protein